MATTFILRKLKNADALLVAIVLAIGAGLLIYLARPAQVAPEKQPEERNGAAAAGGHRLLVLDILREGLVPGLHPALQPARSAHQEMRVLEVESARTLARVELRGSNTSLALSPDAEVLAILYEPESDIGHRPPTLLEFYRTSDLKLVQRGLLPTLPRMFSYAGAENRLSPSGQELIIQGPDPAIRGMPSHLAATQLTCISRELDSDSVFKPCQERVSVPRCYGVELLRVADWPRVQIWNSNLSLLEVVDFSSGTIVSRLPLVNDPTLKTTDPTEWEKAGDSLIFRLRSTGVVLADGGRYGYYLPRQSWEGEGSGLLRKIDLTAVPPKIVQQARKPVEDLRPGAVALSEAGGALFVVQKKYPTGNSQHASRQIRVYSTGDLKFRRAIEVSLGDCNALATSRGGKFLYVLDRDQAKLAVIDAATLREVKVLDQIGKYPFLLFPLPEG